MFEKYNCEEVGKAGSGGEYDVQEGFGWTNGVVLKLLDSYGDVLESGGLGRMGSLAVVLVGLVVAAMV